jgi:hypothetical protein
MFLHLLIKFQIRYRDQEVKPEEAREDEKNAMRNKNLHLPNDQELTGATASFTTSEYMLASPYPFAAASQDLEMQKNASAKQEVLVDLPIGTQSRKYPSKMRTETLAT